MSEESPTPARSRALWWGLGAAALAVVVLTLFIWQPWRSAEPAPQPTPSTPTTQGSVPSASIPPATTSGTPTPVESASPQPTVTASIDEPVDTGSGVTARLSRIRSVKGEAQGPGEVAGPALRVTVKVTNGSKQEIDLSAVVVNLYYGKDATPASQLSGPKPAPFTGSLAAGASTSGSYIFGVPANQRKQVRVEFRYSTDASVAIFEGAA